MKRLLVGNLGPKGSIDNDKVARALLQYRNTPLRDGGASPAQLALGRHIRDTIPLPQQRYRIEKKKKKMLNDREASMASRAVTSKQNFDIGAKSLNKLSVGDIVLCQNPKTRKWDRIGHIVEFKGNRQYLIKLNGSGRLSLINRKHLKTVSEKLIMSRISNKNFSNEDINETQSMENTELDNEDVKMAGELQQSNDDLGNHNQNETLSVESSNQQSKLSDELRRSN